MALGLVASADAAPRKSNAHKSPANNPLAALGSPPSPNLRDPSTPNIIYDVRAQGSDIGNIRLDVVGKPLGRVPVANQHTLGDCYAETAVEIISAYLEKTGSYDPAHPISGIFLAMLANKEQLNNSWGVTINLKENDKIERFRFFFEGGDSVESMDQIILTAGFRRQESEYYLPENSELPVCENAITAPYSNKESLVAYWQSHASDDEKSAVMSGRPKPPGARSAMQQLLGELLAECKASRFHYKIIHPAVLQRLNYNSSGPKTDMYKIVDDMLKNNIPAGINICGLTLWDEKPNFQTGNLSEVKIPPDFHDKCGAHTILIIGRRINKGNGRLEYLLRNTWGQNCNYAGWLKNDCEASKGAFWISADLLFSFPMTMPHLINYEGVYSVYEPIFVKMSDDAVEATLSIDSAHGDAPLLIFHEGSRARLLRNLPDPGSLFTASGYGGFYEGPVKGFAPAGVGVFKTGSGDLIKADFSSGFSGVRSAQVTGWHTTYSGEITDLRVTGFGTMTVIYGGRPIKLTGRFVKGQPNGRVSVTVDDLPPIEVSFSNGKIEPGSPLIPFLADDIESELRFEQASKSKALRN